MAPESTEAPEPRKELHEEAAFLALADALSPLVALIRGDEVVYVNPAGCALLGRPREHVVGRGLRELGLAEARELREAPARFTRRLPHADGHDVWLDCSVAPIRLDGKSRTLLAGHDVSESKRTEEALRLSEERFRSAFQNVAVGKAIALPDQRFLQVNRAYCQMLGYGEDEILARTPVELTYPEDRPLNAALIGRLLSGESSTGRLVKRYLRKDGRIVWGDLALTLIRDAAGKPAFFVAEVVDVTERMRAEDLLRASEARLAEAQRVAHVGSWEYDVATDRSTISEEFYRIGEFDPSTTHLSKEDFFARVHPDDRERVVGLVERALLEGTPFEYEARFLLDSGREKWIQSIGRTDLDAAGRPVRIYGIGQDITERKRAEELLRDREAKLEEAQRVAHLGSWEYDIPSKRSRWSDEMFRIFRLDPVRFDPTRDSAMARIHPDDAARVGALVQETIETGKPYEYEVRIVLDDGEVRSLWTIGRAELGPDGKPARLYGIVQDVTERKRAEDALRASEQRFRNLYAQAPVLMTVVGPDLCFREVSNFWLERFGYERHEVIGRLALEFVAPELRATVVEELHKSLAEGEHVVRSKPTRGLRKDGTTVDALVTSLLEVDAHGRFQGAVTVGLDVSHMRHAEEAVRESEARYRALVQHAPEAIVVADGDNGKFVDVNEQAVRLFRRTREELLSLGPAECSPPFQPNGRPSSEMAQDMIQRTALEMQTFEWIHLDGEGRDIPCLIRLSKMPDRTRNLIRATITDITQQKAIEEKLRQDDRMAAIGVLAAGVAHEIGNPLLALSMAAQSLQRKAQDEYAAKKLALIREHIDRISRIVRQMSDLARAPAQTRSAVDLNRVLERSMEVIRYDKRAKQVAIDVDPCGAVPFVEAVEDQLVQVCLNLALNALDAVAANPPERPKSLRIAVHCLEREGRRYVRTGFRDSGPGIPDAARAQVFQPFFTTKEPGKGTGLGLSVSLRIIEEHQGKLAFDTDPARGTEFFFELPVRERP